MCKPGRTQTGQTVVVLEFSAARCRESNRRRVSRGSAAGAHNRVGSSGPCRRIRAVPARKEETSRPCPRSCSSYRSPPRKREPHFLPPIRCSAASAGPFATPVRLRRSTHGRLTFASKANRSGRNGSSFCGTEPVSTASATSRAVIGASRIPFRKCPVASVRLAIAERPRTGR